ncbi:MAG: hypothetical protein NTZ80_00800 [Patescibacteria group bacterium]|nr:hypothetical protein [Patescibacteria group bacterium]
MDTKSAFAENDSVKKVNMSSLGEQARMVGGSLKSALNKVPNEFKITGVGAVLVFIGSFLPWWSMSATGPYGSTYSISAFNDSTFLLGVLVFLGSIFSLIVAVFEYIGKRPAFIKIPHAFVQMIVGSEMTLLMLIAFSILTSPRFSSTSVIASRIEAGVSYGLFVALIGAVMVAVGGFLEWKGAMWLERLGKKKDGGV